MILFEHYVHLLKDIWLNLLYNTQTAYIDLPDHWLPFFVHAFRFASLCFIFQFWFAAPVALHDSSSQRACVHATPLPTAPLPDPQSTTHRYMEYICHFPFPHTCPITHSVYTRNIMMVVNVEQNEEIELSEYDCSLG